MSGGIFEGTNKASSIFDTPGVVYYFSDGRGNNAPEEFYYASPSTFKGFDAADATHLKLYFKSIKGDFTDVINLQIASNTHKKVADTLYKEFAYNNAAPLAAGAAPIVTIFDATSGSTYRIMQEIEGVTITLGTSNSTYGLVGCAFSTATATAVNQNVSAVVLPFEVQTFLDAGFVNTSNTEKTVVNAGRYRVHCQLGVTSTTANYRWTANLNILKNGSIAHTITGGYIRGSGASFNTELNIDRQMILAAGDIISTSVLRVSNTPGTAALDADECSLSITRLA
tara:strand:+ start:4801 stop:5649 length:849 start_codon:yes stop_codon:yes gene_type:complete